MKRLLFLFASVTISQVLHAQLNKGQWLIGGTTSFSSEKSTTNTATDKTTAVNILPGAGYFIADKFAAGLRTTLSFVNGKSSNNSGSNDEFETKISAYSLTPFVRYYLLPKANKVNLLADASYSYINNKLTTVDMGTSSPTSTFHSHGYSLAAGPAFFLNPKVALELTAGYNHIKINGQSTKNTTVSISAGFQVHLGK